MSARQLSMKVPPEATSERLDTYLFEQGAYPSRSKAAKAIDEGAVFVNGEIVAKRTMVQPGDFIVYEAPEEEGHLPMPAQEIPLNVIWEDDSLLVLDKQPGLICHPSPGHPDMTLSNALLFKYGRGGLAHIQGDDRPGIVHRLDGDTSGLLLCAKTDESGFLLQDQIRSRNVDRHYLCLVHGNIVHDTGYIDAPIFRSQKNRVRMEVSDKPQARSSSTSFKVLERFEAGPRDNGYTLIECKLYSGRTHQIRVHMEYIKHWVVGDQTYKAPGKANELGLERQFLHSHSLKFAHPLTGEEMAYESQLPPDLRQVLQTLEGRSMGLTDAGLALLSEYDPSQYDAAEPSFSRVTTSQDWKVL